MKRFKRELNMSKDDVSYNILMLPYHRRYVEVKKELEGLNEGAGNITISRKIEMRKRKKALRNELRKLWKELNDAI